MSSHFTPAAALTANAPRFCRACGFAEEAHIVSTRGLLCPQTDDATSTYPPSYERLRVRCERLEREIDKLLDRIGSVEDRYDLTELGRKHLQLLRKGNSP